MRSRQSKFLARNADFSRFAVPAGRDDNAALYEPLTEKVVLDYFKRRGHSQAGRLRNKTGRISPVQQPQFFNAYNEKSTILEIHSTEAIAR